MPSPSSEYLVVLRAVVTKLLEVMREPRLPDLSAEEIEYWFHGVRVEDIKKAVYYQQNLLADFVDRDLTESKKTAA